MFLSTVYTISERSAVNFAGKVSQLTHILYTYSLVYMFFYFIFLLYSYQFILALLKNII